MASILGGYLRAREGSYFKQEQEADLHKHRKKLEKEGKLPIVDPKVKEKSFSESEELFEVLPEVLQAQARIDDPNAALRKEFELRIKGQAPPLTPQELHKYRAAMALGPGAAAFGHVPRVSLGGRNRYNFPVASSGSGLTVPRQLTSEGVEVAQRSFVAGMRSLAYGSMLAALALVAAGSAAAHLYSTSEPGEFKGQVQAALQPVADAFKGMVGPVKERVQEWIGPSGIVDRGERQSSAAVSEFQNRLKERYNP